MFIFWVIFSVIAYIWAIYDTYTNNKSKIALLYPLPLFIIIGILIYYWGW
jgi:hypothetical protein